jgi:hypothetical protein
MSRAYAHSGYSFARRQAAPEPIAPPTRRPFSKPKADLQPGSGLALKTAQIIPFPGTLKPEAVDKLPPMDPARLISRPETATTEAVKRLFMLKWWLQECFNDRRLDADAFTIECQLREQAAHIIGFLA